MQCNTEVFKTSDRRQSEKPLIVSVCEVPVTTDRVPAVNADDNINKPGVARANLAPSTEKPNGSPEFAEKYKDYTVVQQHVLFWDRDEDGVITMMDTYNGFRELGFNYIFSIAAMFIINLSFSYPTVLGYSVIPDPFFRIYVPKLHKCKHGSDSGTYDTEGRFVPQAFENIFAQYDQDNKGCLTLGELFGLMHGRRCAFDPFGWFASFFEWGTTWLLIQKDGVVYKEDVRKVYDGSIFFEIAAERKTKTGWNQGYGLGGDMMFGYKKLADVDAPKGW